MKGLCLLYVKGMSPAAEVNLPYYLQSSQFDVVEVSTLAELDDLLPHAILLVTTEPTAFDLADLQPKMIAVLIADRRTPSKVDLILANDRLSIFLGHELRRMEPDDICNHICMFHTLQATRAIAHD